MNAWRDLADGGDGGEKGNGQDDEEGREVVVVGKEEAEGECKDLGGLGRRLRNGSRRVPGRASDRRPQLSKASSSNQSTDNTNDNNDNDEEKRKKKKGCTLSKIICIFGLLSLASPPLLKPASVPTSGCGDQLFPFPLARFKVHKAPATDPTAHILQTELKFNSTCSILRIFPSNYR